MNSKNGFDPPAETEAGEGAASRLQVRHSMPKKRAGYVGKQREMPTTPDMHHAHSNDSPPQGMIDRSLQAQLGRQLRAIFEGIEEEPVPERFVRLLEALEAREKQR